MSVAIKELDYINTRELSPFSGYFALGMILVAVVLSFVYCFGQPIVDRNAFIFDRSGWILITITIVCAFILMFGFVIVRPNTVAVLELFGKYHGNISEQGFYYVNPFASCQRVFTGINNFETNLIRINDVNGTPVDVSAVIEYRVENPANCYYVLGDNANEDESTKDKLFISNYIEGSLRNSLSSLPYDNEQGVSMLSDKQNITKDILEESSSDLKKYGLAITSINLNQLGYGKEIASQMLKRQQAQALVDAKKILANGVKDVVDDLIGEKGNIDEAEYRRMKNNLLVVMISDSQAAPVIDIS